MAGTVGPTEGIGNASDERIDQEQRKLHPFDQHDASVFYTEGHILSVAESGPSNLIEPCHEFKEFTNTTDETKMTKFVNEVIRFGAACMNKQSNGTIHFGIKDKPHGEICGVPVDSNEREEYDKNVRDAIKQRFEFKHKTTADKCIRPPRFVKVLNKNPTPSGKFVIEVDVVPDHVICKDKLFHTFEAKENEEKGQKKGKKRGKKKGKKRGKKKRQFFIRDGSSSRDLLTPNTSDMEDYNWYVDNVKQSSELRKQAEDKLQKFNQCGIIIDRIDSLLS